MNLRQHKRRHAQILRERNAKWHARLRRMLYRNSLTIGRAQRFMRENP